MDRSVHTQNAENLNLAFISVYASSHPWEDWAETLAHYIHIVDPLETGFSFGMTLQPLASEPGNNISAMLDIDPYITRNFKDIIDRWVPLTFAMNSLARSMGMKDSYPFVLNQPTEEKLNFIHEITRERKLSNKFGRHTCQSLILVSIHPSSLRLQIPIVHAGCCS